MLPLTWRGAGRMLQALTTRLPAAVRAFISCISLKTNSLPFMRKYALFTSFLVLALVWVYIIQADPLLCSKTYQPLQAFSWNLPSSDRGSANGALRKNTAPRGSSSSSSSLSPSSSGSLMPVLIISRHSSTLNRSVHHDWWPASAGFRVFGYNISDTHITALHDHSSFPRTLLPLPTEEEGADIDDISMARQRQQNSDIRAALYHFALTVCAAHGNDLPFLIAEDDVQPCEKSAEDFGFLRSWMRDNAGQWGSIRLGVGFTGIIAQCAHLLPFLAHPWGPTEARAIDWALSRFYVQHQERFGPELVYEYNIVQHPRGQGSNIWGSKDLKKRDDKHIPLCYDRIIWAGYGDLTSFDMACANKSRFSPCPHVLK